MNNELETKNIIISEVQQLDWGMKIKDEKTLVYNVPKTIKSGENAGNNTRAYNDLIALPNNGMGLNKAVKFVTVPNKQGGQSRYVRMITEPVIEGEQTTYQSPAMNQSKPVTIEKENVNWDEINEKKRADIKWMNALNNASLLLSNGIAVNEMTKLEEVANYIYKLEPKIDAQKVAEQVGGTVVEKDDINKEISVDSIPF